MVPPDADRPFSCSESEDVSKRLQIAAAHVGSLWRKASQMSSVLKTFTMNHDLKTHLSVHSDLRPHKCSVCEKTFKLKKTLQLHMSLHTGERPYSCSDCGKRFIRTSDLKKHPLVHGGERPHLCVVCEQSFSSRFALSRHLKCFHRVCPVCRTDFSAQTELDAHVRTHVDDRTLDSDSYAAYVRERTNRPFSCSTCGLTFRSDAGLKRHVSVHPGERPYSCSVCERGYSKKSDLNKHMKSHSGERPFVCPVCQKDFGLKKILNKHLKTQHQLCLDTAHDPAAVQSPQSSGEQRPPEGSECF